MWHWYNWAMSRVNGLDPNDWFIVLIGVVVIGAVCMRGFGSRSNF